MNKKIIFEKCNIDQLEILTSTPLNIETIKENLIGNVNILTNGDNLEDSLIEMAGDFGDCAIRIQNSCTFISSDSFIITKPIAIDTPNLSQVSLLGNFTNTKGIKILSSIDLITNQDNSPSKLEITISIKGENPQLHILGNFQESNLTVTSPLTLNLDAKVDEITISDTCSMITLNALSDGYINNLLNYSTIKLSGDNLAVENILSNTTIGSQNIIVQSLSYILKFLDGKVDLKTSFSTPGSYAITLKLLQGDELVQLSPTVNVTIT